MGADGDWTACGGYENRAACPIEDTSTPIMCEDGNCETDGSVCSEQGRGGVKYGSTPCESTFTPFCIYKLPFYIAFVMLLTTRFLI